LKPRGLGGREGCLDRFPYLSEGRMQNHPKNENTFKNTPTQEVGKGHGCRVGTKGKNGPFLTITGKDSFPELVTKKKG